MTYYDAYCTLYEFSNEIYFCNSDILELFEIKDISSDKYNSLSSLLTKSIESGFNEGFKFALKIFSNNL